LYEPLKIEKIVREEWNRRNLRNLVSNRFARESGEIIGYVEGPPTMNGEPHIGHIRGRIMKDLWYRYMTLLGKQVVFRAGWDTQGLPVELQAEKELGLTGSKAENLKRVGMEKLVNKCKELIANYNSRWRLADELVGLQLDYDNAYWTYKDGYIEREWRYLKAAYENGILSEGFRIVAYCPSCQTAVSHSEVGQGYETVEDPSLYFKMKLRDEEAYLVIWTTMPFTIVTDELVGVKPNDSYSYVRVKGLGKPGGDETWVVSSQRLQDLFKELKIWSYEVIKEVKGRDLEGKKYDYPFLDIISSQREIDSEEKVHSVVAEEFVDTTTGTGLVHLSPANGEDDYRVATQRRIPVLNPIDDQVRFTKDSGYFVGKFVREVDSEVVSLLKEKGLVVKVGKIMHEYPCCWRSHHKLVWLLRREYFYWVDRIGETAVQAAERVEYFYEPPRNRFLAIVREKVPWCISRERVWGTPLPIWVCSSCHNKIPVFSKKEIIDDAIELPDGENFELHRPWIDRVKLRCKSCGGIAYREPFVLDTWHNSGAAPYASFDDHQYDTLVPVEFLTEGIDQTRGWAYSLLIENVILKNKAEAPYRSFLFQGLIVDDKGAKMSKSLGNYVEGIEVLSSYPVDVLRFYLLWKTSPVDQLAFNEKEIMGRPFQVLNTLYHLHVYFLQNSQYDNFDSRRHTISLALASGSIKPRDKWILSRLQGLIRKVTESIARCQYHEGARAIEEFVVGDLSQGYLPLVRADLWSDDQATLPNRLTIYSVLDHILRVVRILLHPYSPYLTEYLTSLIPLNNTDKKPATQLLLASAHWPKPDPTLQSVEVERTFETIFSIVALANSARSRAKVKRRWPLKGAMVVVDENTLSRLRQNKDMLRDLLNVQTLNLSSDLSQVDSMVDFVPKKQAIEERGGEFRTVSSRVRSIRSNELYRILRDEKQAKFDGIDVFRSDLEIVPKQTPERATAADFSKIVSLDISRDYNLVAEGLLRDVARQLQALRKKKGFNPTQILEEAAIAGLTGEQREMLSKRERQLAFLVRVKKVSLLGSSSDIDGWEKTDIDGREVFLKVH
jgi:isoleucyl-tRNA synthetase